MELASKKRNDLMLSDFFFGLVPDGHWPRLSKSPSILALLVDSGKGREGEMASIWHRLQNCRFVGLPEGVEEGGIRIWEPGTVQVNPDIKEAIGTSDRKGKRAGVWQRDNNFRCVGLRGDLRECTRILVAATV